jgi:orotate phosphoribosyltransferase
MKQQQVLDIFRECGAILHGHFILSSGLRSPVFLQKARVFMHADKTETLCKALAEKIRAKIPEKIDYVVGPAIGGIIPAYETSRQLGVPNIWVERENGEFRLRRFDIEEGANVVIIEDIVST